MGIKAPYPPPTPPKGPYELELESQDHAEKNLNSDQYYALGVLWKNLALHSHIYIYVCVVYVKSVYIYIYVCVCVCVYVYTLSKKSDHIPSARKLIPDSSVRDFSSQAVNQDPREDPKSRSLKGVGFRV